MNWNADKLYKIKLDYKEINHELKSLSTYDPQVDIVMLYTEILDNNTEKGLIIDSLRDGTMGGFDITTEGYITYFEFLNIKKYSNINKKIILPRSFRPFADVHLSPNFDACYTHIHTNINDNNSILSVRMDNDEVSEYIRAFDNFILGINQFGDLHEIYILNIKNDPDYNLSETWRLKHTKKHPLVRYIG